MPSKTNQYLKDLLEKFQIIEYIIEYHNKNGLLPKEYFEPKGPFKINDAGKILSINQSTLVEGLRKDTKDINGIQIDSIIISNREDGSGMIIYLKPINGVEKQPWEKLLQLPNTSPDAINVGLGIFGLVKSQLESLLSDKRIQRNPLIRLKDTIVTKVAKVTDRLNTKPDPAKVGYENLPDEAPTNSSFGSDMSGNTDPLGNNTSSSSESESDRPKLK